MAYTAWSVVFGEQPTAAKWNQLGANDAGFKDGTNIDNLAILDRHIAANNLHAGKITNPYKFSAYKSGGNQAIGASVATKISFQTERFDTNSNFDNATNYRYTIPVTGFYFVNTIIQTLRGDATTDNNLAIYKNGVLFRKGGNMKAVTYPQHQVIGFFQFTAGDYLEVFFINVVAADSVESGTGTSSTFEGFLVSSI